MSSIGAAAVKPSPLSPPSAPLPEHLFGSRTLASLGAPGSSLFHTPSIEVEQLTGARTELLMRWERLAQSSGADPVRQRFLSETAELLRGVLESAAHDSTILRGELPGQVLSPQSARSQIRLLRKTEDQFRREIAADPQAIYADLLKDSCEIIKRHELSLNRDVAAHFGVAVMSEKLEKLASDVFSLVEAKRRGREVPHELTILKDTVNYLLQLETTRLGCPLSEEYRAVRSKVSKVRAPLDNLAKDIALEQEGLSALVRRAVPRRFSDMVPDKVQPEYGDYLNKVAELIRSAQSSLMKDHDL